MNRFVDVDLSRFDNHWYHPGAGLAKRLAWYVVNAVVFHSWLLPWSWAKRGLLRLFGARVGAGVVIKPRVNIKYPWFLQVGDHVWIGEDAWIDNLAPVTLESNVCVSQGAYLLTGNHDYRDAAFGLKAEPVHVEAGAWVGACAIVCPGVRVGREAVLTAGSVLASDATPGGVYQGNPARRVRERVAGAGSREQSILR